MGISISAALWCGIHWDEDECIAADCPSCDGELYGAECTAEKLRTEVNTDKDCPFEFDRHYSSDEEAHMLMLKGSNTDASWGRPAAVDTSKTRVDEEALKAQLHAFCEEYGINIDSASDFGWWLSSDAC